MIVREAISAARNLLSGNYVLSIIGPRQAGKTTLARLLAPTKPYVSLEEPDVREHARSDPRGFLAGFPDGAVLDEIQRCPDLLSYLQVIVDRERRTGGWIITGSNQFALQHTAAQTLAGRVGQLTLLPLAWSEIQTTATAPVSWEAAVARSAFPPLFDRALEPAAWLRDYVATYVERDVRLALNIQNLAAFQRFLALCAGRTGQLLNLAALAADTGIDQRTARTWLTVLELSFLVVLLPPFFRNRNKRLVKTPKLYFADAGLAAWLLGVREAAQLRTHPLRGALCETWVVAELLKAAHNAGRQPALSFYRTRDGAEVDIVAETARGCVAIEVKSGATVGSDFFAGFEPLKADLGDELVECRLIYGGERSERRPEAIVSPWHQIGEVAAVL